MTKKLSHYWLSAISNEIKLSNYRDKDSFIFYKNVSDMAHLMGMCDAAISAGGSTCNELCAVGVPFICFSVASNQTRACEALEKRGAALYAGDLHRQFEGNPDLQDNSPYHDENIEDKIDSLTENIIGKFIELISSADLRKRLSDNAKKEVSPTGADNLARALIGA